MKRLMFLLPLLAVSFAFAQQPQFDKYFENHSLRIDYIQTVNDTAAYVAVEQIKKEPYWGGTHTQLIEPFGYGAYRIQVYDSLSGKLIYTYGYNALSEEWRRMPEAKGKYRSFYESAVIPFPKNTVKFVLLYRDKHLKKHKLLETYINPNSIYINKEQKYNFKAYDLVKNGDPAHKVDIVFIAEGYTKDQMPQFRKDVQHFVDVLFNYHPFAEHKKDFNIHVIESISPESGTDIPGENVWKNTILNSSFYTFGIERYVTTFDIKTLRDIASLVPYDQIFVLVNTGKYGGSGFYNFYNIGVSRNPLADPVMVHEFGHGFAGLADEYWTAGMDENFYDKTVEPVEPNITTLVNFDSKWKDMVNDTVPVPTPSTPQYRNVVGAFEGAGYSPKGIYRPEQNCLMRSLGYDFCKVCQRSIEKVISYYVK